MRASNACPAGLLGLLGAILIGGTAFGQTPPPGPAPSLVPGDSSGLEAPAPFVPSPVVGPIVIDPAPGIAAVGEPMPGVMPAAPVLLPEIQVVRFQGPEGVQVDVLGPNPEPAPIGDGSGLATFGFRVGIAYQLRISNLPNRPGAEIFPLIEVVGHLHRPDGIDPSKYPIRVQIDQQDLEDVLIRGRLVTHVVYLEDPEQALPINLPRGQIPVTEVGPAEDPLKVAAALGRPMAIVRLGGRTPTAQDLSGAPFLSIGGVACPFVGTTGAACSLPCGPARGTPPPTGRPWVPADEYLCDGGDHEDAAAFGGDGGLRGIDPRDAVIRFNDGKRPRILPTNKVCIYAPRYAAVRAAIGANQAYSVEVLAANEILARQEMKSLTEGPERVAQNLAAELARHRERASEAMAKQFAGGYAEVRVLAGLDTVLNVDGHVLVQGPESSTNREKAMAQQLNLPTLAIKTAESAVVTGIVQGANQQVMSWKPQETVGVEEPPNRPGMAVVKQVDLSEAEPGDIATYTIRFRNMGNVPIRAVSVVDSLLPRLEYLPGSAEGPKGTVFTSGANGAGSTELRWDLPGELAPGAEGYVLFKAKVR